MRYVLRVDGRTFTIRSSRDEPEADHAPELRDRARARAFLRRASADRANRRAIRAVLRDHGRFEAILRRDDAEILRVAADEVASGALLIGWRVPPRPVRGSVSRVEIEPVPVKVIDKRPESELTWIEIELLDEDGNPVAGEDYRIGLPDGAVRSGKLDSKGRARERGLDPGTCKVSFPNLDPAAWEFSESSEG